LSKHLEALPKKTQEERKFIMRLAPLYEQEQEQMFKQGEVIGLQKGEAKLVLRLINRRFGEIPQNLTETIQKLSIEQLENLGEALLDFDNQTDLVQWLNHL
jgi:predicted transposase YdaD